jgi:glycosyltransferase involved in cell wall biosynthesis
MPEQSIPETLGYLSGPVDAREVYDSVFADQHTRLFGSSYLGQIFKILAAAGSKGVVVTSLDGDAYDAERPGVAILNRPKTQRGGWRYHHDMFRWTYERLRELEDRGVQVVVLTDAQDYWFATLPFRVRGMRFVNSYHCVIRPYRHRRLSPHEAMKRLTSLLHLSFGDPTIAVSPHILSQVAGEWGSRRRHVGWFRPHYTAATFANCTAQPPAKSDGSKDVLFAGRVEANKGVFDLLEACRILSQREGPTVRFHIHGEGAALPELTDAVQRTGLGDLFIVHGFTPGSELAAHYERCDVVVVPTRSDFEEGLAKSVLEGVLSLRPVVTSRVCPAIEIVGEACLEAKVDDAADYAECIWRLVTDPALAAEKAAAAEKLRGDFFDPRDSYATRLTEALLAVR